MVNHRRFPVLRACPLRWMTPWRREWRRIPRNGTQAVRSSSPRWGRHCRALLPESPNGPRVLLRAGRRVSRQPVGRRRGYSRIHHNTRETVPLRRRGTRLGKAYRGRCLRGRVGQDRHRRGRLLVPRRRKLHRTVSGRRRERRHRVCRKHRRRVLRNRPRRGWDHLPNPERARVTRRTVRCPADPLGRGRHRHHRRATGHHPAILGRINRRMVVAAGRRRPGSSVGRVHYS